MNEQRTNQDNLLDALSAAQAKLDMIQQLCAEEEVWNRAPNVVNAEVLYFADDIRAALHGATPALVDTSE